MAMVPTFAESDDDPTPRFRRPPMFHRGFSSPWLNLLRLQHTFSDYVGEKQIEKGDIYTVELDVRNFNHDEIRVKTKNGYIMVAGGHPDKEAHNGTVSRQFVRRYKLPPGHREEDVRATFTETRLLVIEAPKQRTLAGERRVPILSTVRASVAGGPAPRPIRWEDLATQNQPARSDEKNNRSSEKNANSNSEKNASSKIEKNTNSKTEKKDNLKSEKNAKS